MSDPTNADPVRSRCEAMFLANLPLIHRLIAAVARQHRLSADEAEEFGSVVRLRMISDDYAVLRKFGGRSTLRTFLTVVIQRMCLDFRAAQWGKWRPSMRSRRAGNVAILLERLTIRDGLTFDEACNVLEINHGLSADRDTLAQIYAGLKLPGRRRPAKDIELNELPTVDYAPDRPLMEAEDARVLAGAAEALGRALARLDPRDRLILQLRYADRMTVADIARTLELNQKWLFRRIDRLTAMLRKELESDGLRADAVLPAIGYTKGSAISVVRVG